MLEYKMTEGGLYMHTIIAYRSKGNFYWKLTFFPYDRNDIIEALAYEKINYEECRIVFSHSTMIGLGDLFYKQYAINCGWIPHYDGQCWSAPGETVPEYPAQSRLGNVDIELESISRGWLSIVASERNAGKIKSTFGDLNNPLIGLTRLTDNIRNGRDGHMAVADDAIYIAFHVWNRPDDLSHLRVRNYNQR